MPVFFKKTGGITSWGARQTFLKKRILKSYLLTTINKDSYELKNLFEL